VNSSEVERRRSLLSRTTTEPSATQSFKRREIAAERRERWESLHPGHEEIVPSPVSEF
jgi:hypothetical protein